MRLIDRRNDIVIEPESTVSTRKLTRRDFIAYSALAPSLLLLPHQKAHAIFPFLIGVIARSIIPGVARGVSRHVAKKLVTHGGKKVASSRKNAAMTTAGYLALSEAVQASIVEEVATNLTNDGITNVSKYAIDRLAATSPEALWAKTDKVNTASVDIENKRDQYVESSFAFVVKDLRTGEIEYSNQEFTLEAEPFQKANFQMDSFIDLPRTGEKKVAGIIPKSSGIDITSSGKILVLNTEEIYI